MLGQAGKVRNGPFNVIKFHHHGWEADGEPGGVGDAHWDSQHNVHTHQ